MIKKQQLVRGELIRYGRYVGIAGKDSFKAIHLLAENEKEALAMGVKGFFQKPYSLEWLSKAVAKLLHA